MTCAILIFWFSVVSKSAFENFSLFSFRFNVQQQLWVSRVLGDYIINGCPVSHKVWHANEFSMLSDHERRVCQHLQPFGGWWRLHNEWNILEGTKNNLRFSAIFLRTFVWTFSVCYVTAYYPKHIYTVLKYYQDNSHPVFENLYIL